MSKTATKWALRLVVIGYVFFLVAWPTFLVLERAFSHGVAAFFNSFNDPAISHALALTWTITGWAVVINLVFGVATSMLLVRYDFWGKRIYSVLLDIPLSVSPVVVGLALVLVYNGRDGWFGPWLGQHGIQILFSVPGMVMATVFVALPLVIREVVPVLQELGDEQEQAARSLGANGFQVFRRITLPGIKWAVVYGVVLALARSIGEFGAVKIVSGNIVGRSQTATLAVEQTYENFQPEQSYAISALLALIAMICLLVVALLRTYSQKDKA
jgi:sulfate transport system permease protein